MFILTSAVSTVLARFRSTHNTDPGRKRSYQTPLGIGTYVLVVSPKLGRSGGNYGTSETDTVTLSSHGGAGVYTLSLGITWTAPLGLHAMLSSPQPRRTTKDG